MPRSHGHSASDRSAGRVDGEGLSDRVPGNMRPPPGTPPSARPSRQDLYIRRRRPLRAVYGAGEQGGVPGRARSASARYRTAMTRPGSDDTDRLPSDRHPVKMVGWRATRRASTYKRSTRASRSSNGAGGADPLDRPGPPRRGSFGRPSNPLWPAIPNRSPWPNAHWPSGYEAESAVELLSRYAVMMGELAERAAAIYMVLVAAADVDPELADLLAEFEKQRLKASTMIAEAVRDRGGLPFGRSLAEARDTIWVCNAPEMYVWLTSRRRCSNKRYVSWAREHADQACRRAAGRGRGVTGAGHLPEHRGPW